MVLWSLVLTNYDLISNNDYVIIPGRMIGVSPPGLPRCKQRLRVGITFNYSVLSPGFAVSKALLLYLDNQPHPIMT